MSSVIIVKDMKTPKNCKECKIACEPYLSLDGLLEKFSMSDSVRSDCPLIEVPSADVQPVVHGEWVDGGVDSVGACGIEYRYNKCSVCGYVDILRPMKYNFCPICGARMDGGTEEMEG